jgi:hypothetical protein
VGVAKARLARLIWPAEPFRWSNYVINVLDALLFTVPKINVAFFIN